MIAPPQTGKRSFATAAQRPIRFGSISYVAVKSQLPLRRNFGKMLTSQWLGTIGITPYTTQRVGVYILGGTQIGLAGAGQGPDILSFPQYYVVGDALQSPHWVRFLTPEELAMDPVRRFQILSQAEKPSF